MGIDVYVLDFLLRTGRKKPLGETLWLGRQGFHIRGEQLTIAQAVVDRHVPGNLVADIAGTGAYAEQLFKWMGASQLTAMDHSPFEGAHLLQDLNQPVPPSLHDRFDCIFDGGTVEHIFNVPMALANVNSMLRRDGVFLSVNAANNQLGHGFYQFSPELMWRVFSRKSGYEIEAMYLMEITGLMPSPRTLTDPAVVGRREEIGRTAGPTYLMVAARKLEHVPLDAVQQSDYEKAWLMSQQEVRQ